MRAHRMWMSVMAVALVGASPAGAAVGERESAWSITSYPVSVDSTGTDRAGLAAPVATSQWAPGQDPRFTRQSLSGPRVGFTLATGNGDVHRSLQREHMGRLVSQFGWQFERRVAPLGGGPELVTEVLPMVGGVEYGKLVPSLNVALGVRTRSRLEFGMGPSLSLAGDDARSRVGLLLAVGKSFDYDGVSLPVNLVVSTNPWGTRVTLTGGYAIERLRN